MILRRLKETVNLTSPLRFYLLSRAACNYYTKANSTATEAAADKRQTASTTYPSRIHLSPLFGDEKSVSGGYDIEVVDDDAWQVSSGLLRAWRGSDKERERKPDTQAFDERLDGGDCLPGDSDFDEIDNMRIRGSLFYKIDRESKEFEEYSFDFHRRKSSKRKEDPKGNVKKESSKKDDSDQERKRKENPGRSAGVEVEKLPRFVRSERVYALLDNVEKKKVRTPTFNQLTAPYHEPFCLDIYISKASVRACVVHRVTSKVVAVAHSISKDMKFDLASTRNEAACAAVGKILAQRALEDDIHNVLYTPRKEERLEGKRQIVLQSIIDNGVNVKVKLKQRKQKKASPPSSA